MHRREDLSAFCVKPGTSLREAVAAIDKNLRGIAMVVDEDRRLIGTITDGDVRRAMLAGRTLDTSVDDILAQKRTSKYPQPVTATVETDALTLLQVMHDLVIRQIPLLDEEGRLADLVTMEDLLPEETMPLQAVIMAGGFGTRLLPLTQDTPKPMLPVGDKPLMELIIAQLRQSGIHRVNVSTHFQRDKIKSHFGNGENFGVAISYVDEARPLGTAGALSLMAAPTEPLLVINGDILTDVPFRAMLQFHKEHRAEMTVAVRRYEVQVPYGVVECDQANVRGLTEKPQFSFFVNAGMYLLEPTVHDLIPSGELFNMPDLIQRLLDAGRPVVSFPIREYWLDIGRLADYETAQADMTARMKS
jgi:dTDP-glucose pyrophosphorylase/CBS domain-containing protein